MQCKLVASIRIRFCTVDFLLKLNGGHAGAKMEMESLMHILLMDEVEEVPRPDIGALLAHGVSAAVLTGTAINTCQGGVELELLRRRCPAAHG